MVEPKEYEVVLYPDPVLRRETDDVTEFGEELAAIAAGMLERMFESRGVGLAGPQVGLSRRIFVVNEEGDPEKRELDRVFVNPIIKSRGGRKVAGEEGCLSLPGVYAEITRPERCTVEWQDVEGAKHEADLEGFVARVVQHEFDHLEGVLLVDRMTPADKVRNKAALEELRERHGAAG